MDINKAMRVLGLKPGFTEKELKNAHRTLSKKYHPDTVLTGNEDKFKEVNNAYSFLKTNYELDSKNNGSYNSETYEDDEFMILKMTVYTELITLKLAYGNNKKTMAISEKYKHLMNNATTVSELKQILGNLQEDINEISNNKIKTKIEANIEILINKVSKYADFEVLKTMIYEEKQQILNEVNQKDIKLDDDDIEEFISRFELKVLEIFAFYKYRIIKFKNLKTKLNNLPSNKKTFEMLNLLEESLKNEHFNQRFLEAFNYMKSLNDKTNTTIINTIYQYLLSEEKNIKSSLDFFKDNDEITRINNLSTRLNNILAVGLLEIITIDELTILFKFDYSKDSEEIIDYLEKRIIEPRSTNIIINKSESSNPFYSFDDYNEEIFLANRSQRFADCYSKFKKMTSLEDFFDKADLIGDLAILDYNIIILIAKYENLYLAFNITSKKFLLTSYFKYYNKSIMSSNYTLLNNNEKELLENVKSNNINAIKQTIVNYVAKIKNKNFNNNFKKNN